MGKLYENPLKLITENILSEKLNIILCFYYIGSFKTKTLIGPKWVLAKGY